MIRLLTLAMALLTSLMLLGATASVARAPAYYLATPSVAPTQASLVTDGTLWKCEAGVCAATKAPVRDPIMCQMVAQRVGTLASFSANGVEFDPATLAKCNARAK